MADSDDLLALCGGICRLAESMEQHEVALDEKTDGSRVPSPLSSGFLQAGLVAV